MTVSRVINNSGPISKATREKVEHAIAELGYVPNALARSLHKKQTETIALILTDITNPFFTTIARGVEDTASEFGFTVMFCNTDESEDVEFEYLNVLLQKQVDGVLLVPAGGQPTSINLLQKHKVPLVILDRHVEGVSIDSVRGDSVGGAYKLVSYLIELGHRRIAVLSGPRTISTSTERVEGYKKAMRDAGIDSYEELIYFCKFTVDSGYEIGREMMIEALSRHDNITAVFAANNFIATGAYRILRDFGLKVPDDISLVSFDDLPHPLLMNRFLTTTSHPAYEIGEIATQLLLERLLGKTTGEPREIILPTEIIIGESSAPPRSDHSVFNQALIKNQNYSEV